MNAMICRGRRMKVQLFNNYYLEGGMQNMIVAHVKSFRWIAPEVEKTTGAIITGEEFTVVMHRELSPRRFSFPL